MPIRLDDYISTLPEHEQQAINQPTFFFGVRNAIVITISVVFIVWVICRLIP
jgi:hypothetical protein